MYKFKLRNQVKKEAIKSNSNEKWNEWRKLKNKVNNRVRNERENQSNSEFVECEKYISR